MLCSIKFNFHESDLKASMFKITHGSPLVNNLFNLLYSACSDLIGEYRFYLIIYHFIDFACGSSINLQQREHALVFSLQGLKLVQ